MIFHFVEIFLLHFFFLLGRLGHQPPDVLRERLENARKNLDISALKSSIQECEEAGYPELGVELQKARDTLETLGGGRGG